MTCLPCCLHCRQTGRAPAAAGPATAAACTLCSRSTGRAAKACRLHGGCCCLLSRPLPSCWLPCQAGCCTNTALRLPLLHRLSLLLLLLRGRCCKLLLKGGHSGLGCLWCGGTWVLAHRECSACFPAALLRVAGLGGCWPSRSPAVTTACQPRRRCEGKATARLLRLLLRLVLLLLPLRGDGVERSSRARPAGRCCAASTRGRAWRECCRSAQWAAAALGSCGAVAAERCLRLRVRRRRSMVSCCWLLPRAARALAAGGLRPALLWRAWRVLLLGLLLPQAGWVDLLL